MPTDRKRTKWVQGGIVGEPDARDIISMLDGVVNDEDGPWKFGWPADTDITKVGAGRGCLDGKTRCRVCGKEWWQHMNWECTTKRRRRS